MEHLPKLNESDLKPWFDKVEMIHDCVAQVQKDLGNYGIQLTFSGNVLTAYQELFQQLEPQLNQLIKRGSSLMEILYRVDVDESKVKQVAELNEPFSASLTRLILWRELQKVVTRFLLSRES